MSERCLLLNKIRTRSFALVETSLYLDGHPGCQRAIEYYKSTREELDRLTAEYEEKFGALTQKGAIKNGVWTWTDSPWPWERECDC